MILVRQVTLPTFLASCEFSSLSLTFLTKLNFSFTVKAFAILLVFAFPIWTFRSTEVKATFSIFIMEEGTMLHASALHLSAGRVVLDHEVVFYRVAFGA